MSSINTLTPETKLADEIKSKGITVVDYYADWCGPCNMLSPIMNRLAEIDGVTVIKVNTEDHVELSSEQNISNLPTIQFYKDGKLVKEQKGVAPMPVLQKILEDL